MRFWLPLLALLPLSGTLAVSAGYAANTGHKTLVLSDFSKPADRAHWAVNGAVRLDEEAAGRCVFGKWQRGQDEWPALRLPLRDGVATDWSGYDALVLHARNPSPLPVDVTFYIGDPEGESTTRHFALAPGDAAVRFPLFEADRVNLARLSELRLFLTRPAADTTLDVQSLSLTEDLDGRLAMAERRLSALEKDANSDGFPALFTSPRQEAANLAEGLAAARTGEAREALRPAIVSFADATVHRLPRALSEARMRRSWRVIESRTPYALGFATSMEKVFPRDIPFHAQVAREGALSLAGNETEALQLLILAGPEGLKDVQVEVGPLVRAGGHGTIPAESVRVAPVGFVQTKRPPYRADYLGWYPDPILNYLRSFDVKPGEMQPVWVSVRTPAGLPAGSYQGEITVQPGNAPVSHLRLRVEVWGFDLSKETHLRTAVDYRPAMVEQVYGRLTPKMNARYQDFLLRHRLNPDSIYRSPLVRKDGAPLSPRRASQDENIYLNIPPRLEDLKRWNLEGMNAFNILYVMKPKDLAPGAPYLAKEKQQILATLDAVIPAYKAAGLYEKAYVYGFDEVNTASKNAMADIFGAIKARYPDLPILTTAYAPTYGDAWNLPMVDNWVPLTPNYDAARAAEARKRGKRVWWYICVAPKSPYANFFLEYPAIGARMLMGLQTAKFRTDGFLYYALNRWPLSKHPITGGPYTDWPTWSFGEYNGDGSVLCAGPDGPLSTIRLENMTDGIEDNEYFWLLRQEAARLRSIPGADAAAALRQAEAAFSIGDDLVKAMNDFTREPEALYAKRRQVAEAILAARKIRPEGQPMEGRLAAAGQPARNRHQ